MYFFTQICVHKSIQMVTQINFTYFDPGRSKDFFSLFDPDRNSVSILSTLRLWSVKRDL